MEELIVYYGRKFCMNEYVVVIPVYKESMSVYERASFEQCLRVVNTDIVLITYKELNLSCYREIEKLNIGNKNVTVEYFDSRHFKEGLYGYNDLLLSEEFYKRFSKYEYMLIYQLDAYVFKADFSYYFKNNIDYVGAPCFEGFNHATEMKYINFQNGGFSLRNISKCRQACVEARKISGLWKLYKARFLGKRYLLDNAGYRLGFVKHLPLHWEDMFFSKAAPLLVDNYKVASYEESYMFSFDCLPQLLFERTNHQLPLGCHAFHKDYKWKFWENYIPLD